MEPEIEAKREGPTLKEIIGAYLKREGITEAVTAERVSAITGKTCSAQTIRDWGRRGITVSASVRALSVLLGIPQQEIEAAAKESKQAELNSTCGNSRLPAMITVSSVRAPVVIENPTLKELIRNYCRPLRLTHANLAMRIGEIMDEPCDQRTIVYWGNRGVFRRKAIRALSELMGIPMPQIEAAARRSYSHYYRVTKAQAPTIEEEISEPTLQDIILAYRRRNRLSKEAMATKIGAIMGEPCSTTMIGDWGRRGVLRSAPVRALSELIGVPMTEIEAAAKRSRARFKGRTG